MKTQRAHFLYMPTWICQEGTLNDYTTTAMIPKMASSYYGDYFKASVHLVNSIYIFGKVPLSRKSFVLRTSPRERQVAFFLSPAEIMQIWVLETDIKLI